VYAAGTISLGKRVLLKLLQRAMRAEPEAMASDLFQERIARFVALDRPGRRVAIRVGDAVHHLPKRTRRNGHFLGAVRIPTGELLAKSIASGEAAGHITAQLPVEVCDALHRSLCQPGRAYLLAPRGLSIISDIDDTLKHSMVACKRTLLTNTFLRPFETIPGMAELFRDWAGHGVAFHYVSSSPWQLYEHLAGHLADQGFPDGSYHLRSFRLRDHLLRRVLMLRRSGKASVIRSMFKNFPQRRFLLVGDSGEADPEIYGAMARRFPDQVAGIFIRQIHGRRDTAARYERAFREVPEPTVRLFREADELRDVQLDCPHM
jgi:phosphatidate phosphatase APP1